MKKILSKDGTAIAIDRTGRGPALVFVDGAMCYRASGPSQPMAAALADHFTVFTYDRRGRGDSSDTGPYDVQREVDDLDAVIREAGGQAVVFGVSSGAALALEAASRGAAITRLAPASRFAPVRTLATVPIGPSRDKRTWSSRRR